MNDPFDFVVQHAALWLAIGLVLLSLLLLPVLLYVTSVLVSLPLRRQERGRFFLDLVETGLQSGQSLEQAIVGMSHSQDRTLGARFHLLAAHLETGLRLEQALECVPRLLPPPIRAMLKAGAQLGDLTKVLTACRQHLKDGVSQTRGALNYLLVLAFVVTPVMPFFFIMIHVYILPRMQMLVEDMMGVIPPLTRLAFGWCSVLSVIQLGLLGLVLLLVLCYVGGPRLRSCGSGFLFSFLDRLSLWLPWRRKRMQRDFAAMLAILLDAEIPEPTAVKLAAESTANGIFMQRAEAAVQRLQQGAKLMEAVQAIDGSGEFRWRLTNASGGGGRFRAALAGWVESLDARAFQQEQAAAQLFTTSLVFVNGLMVGLLAVGLFSIFLTLINAVLW